MRGGENEERNAAFPRRRPSCRRPCQLRGWRRDTHSSVVPDAAQGASHRAGARPSIRRCPSTRINPVSAGPVQTASLSGKEWLLHAAKTSSSLVLSTEGVRTSSRDGRGAPRSPGCRLSRRSGSSGETAGGRPPGTQSHWWLMGTSTRERAKIPGSGARGRRRDLWARGDRHQGSAGHSAGGQESQVRT